MNYLVRLASSANDLRLCSLRVYSTALLPVV
jgi:hypothetical protein